MAKSGLNRKLQNEFIDALNAADVSKQNLDDSEERKAFGQDLLRLASLLQSVAEECNALASLEAERLCIEFEKSHYVHGDAARLERLQKQLDYSVEASSSLTMLEHSEKYRSAVLDAHPEGLGSRLPDSAYAFFADRQARYFSRAQDGFVSSEKRIFFNARQSNMRAGLKHFQSLQQKALFQVES